MMKRCVRARLVTGPSRGGVFSACAIQIFGFPVAQVGHFTTTTTNLLVPVRESAQSEKDGPSVGSRHLTLKNSEPIRIII